MGEVGKAVDWAAVRARLSAERGPRLWRCLEELADDEEFLGYLRAEFPGPAALLDAGVSRRSFLKLMGASLALAGLNACSRQPAERIFPYVDQPEQLVPGRPLYYATAFAHAGYALGVLAESHLGRPTKLEGNPLHPESLGATDVLAQAAVLSLYDPDRAQVVTRGDEILPWASLASAVAEVMKRYEHPANGEGLRILTPTVTSPTLAAQMGALAKRYPRARWHRWEPVACDAARRGSELAFEELFDVRYDLGQADVIVSLDADFLCSGPSGVRLAREFARGRALAASGGGHGEGEQTAPERAAGVESTRMNRLYVLESTVSTTGAKADHRLALDPLDIERVALRLAVELGLETRAEPLDTRLEAWTLALARDLERVRGRSAVIAGEAAPAAVHALAHFINGALGNAHKTVAYTRPVEADPVVHGDSLRDLTLDMRARRVSTLVILGGNPVYDAPVDLDFAAALREVEVVVRLGAYDDETSRLSHWNVPEAHWLETWSDVRAADGTVTIQQPLIEPLYGGKSAHEMVALLLGDARATSYDIVREHWRGRMGERELEARWRTALHEGVVADTAEALRRPELRWDLAARIERERAESAERRQQTAAPPPAGTSGAEVTVVFRPDVHVWDGRYANNGWLQELPRPITQLVWDNAALVAPALAERMHLGNGDVVQVSAGERFVLAPVWITPGHPDAVVTLPLGYGRPHAGRVGSGLGFDAYRLRTAGALWHLAGARIAATGASQALASTQMHHSMEGRPLVRTATLEEYRSDPGFARSSRYEGAVHDEPASLYPEYEYEGYAWGMTIDLGACTGCHACTIACQAENNIPVVGKAQVAAGREMHWIRVDRYFEGDLDSPAVHFQPVPCMHCEKAPCEVVCPVNATVHSDEGLNDMVYNRCVGTRYCQNNCPYKVRRFNFFQYQDWSDGPRRFSHNPDVTVRSRGVMEKCTYCVQRVSAARIEAKKESRRIRDGEVQTACQQVCPSEAISFGDLNDRAARVRVLKEDPRNYALLGEIGTQPRTTYLASVRNPNPEIEALAATHDSDVSRSAGEPHAPRRGRAGGEAA